MSVQSTQHLLTRVPETSIPEVNEAVAVAARAFKSWSRTSVIARQQFVIE